MGHLSLKVLPASKRSCLIHVSGETASDELASEARSLAPGSRALFTRRLITPGFVVCAKQTKMSSCRLLKGRCSSSHKVSRDWLATFPENNRTNNKTIPPTLKTIAAATQLKQLQAYESYYTSVLMAVTRLNDSRKKCLLLNRTQRSKP